MKILPEIKLLTIFQTVSQCQSVSKAAKLLKLTQSAVSHQIKRLEKQLDVTLFERESRPLKLTKAGRYLLERNEQLIQELTETVNFLQNKETLVLPEIRLGMGSYIAELCLAPVIKNIESRVKTIHVNTGAASELNNDFHEQKYDCILTTKPLELNENIVEHKICQQSLVGLQSTLLQQKFGQTVNLDILLEKVLFIDFHTTTQLGALIKQFFFHIGKKPKRKITVDTVPCALQVLKHIPSWSLCLPLTLINHIDLLEQKRIEPFVLSKHAFVAEIFQFASKALPSEVVDLIQKTVRFHIKKLILEKQFKGFSALGELVKVV